MMKKQLQWINIVKGITITVVVFLHVNYQGYCDTCFYQLKNIIGDAWDMPVFFLLGGFFISREKLSAAKDFLFHKFHTIYLKLIFYYIAFLCLHNVLIHAGMLSTTVDYGGKQMALFSLFDFLKALCLAVFFMGREPYLAPLWFIYVMFMAFIIMACLAYSVAFFTKNNSRGWHIAMAVTLAVLCMLSLYCTNSLGINIPRCNNVFSAAWLIFTGYCVRNVFHVSFSNGYAALLSLICLSAICFFSDHMALITNSYRNIAQLTVCGLSALYTLSYLARRMEGTLLGRCIAFLGQKSYHIMALHLLGISLFSTFSNAVCHTSYPVYKLGSEASSLPEALLITAAGIVLSLIITVSLTALRRLCTRKQS